MALVKTLRTDDFLRARRHESAQGERARAFLRYDNPRSNIDSLCRESTEWMIHEDLSSGARRKKRRNRSRSPLASIMRFRFSEHEVPSVSHHDDLNSFTGGHLTATRLEGGKSIVKR